MKHSMKKIVILLLALVYIITFVACGENETTGDIGDTANSSSSTTEAPTMGEPASDETTAPEPVEPEPTEPEPTEPEPTEPEPTTSEGLEFRLNDDGKSYYVSGIGTCTDTDIIIPDTYNGLPVTRIGNYAFCGCSGLTAITIPDSVTSIGDYAFSGCDNLTSIIVADGNPVYHSAGNCLIETESKTLVAGCATSVIPTDGSVTSIGDDAFSCRFSLMSITIPDRVTSN